MVAGCSNEDGAPNLRPILRASLASAALTTLPLFTLHSVDSIVYGVFILVSLAMSTARKLGELHCWFRRSCSQAKRRLGAGCPEKTTRQTPRSPYRWVVLRDTGLQVLDCFTSPLSMVYLPYAFTSWIITAYFALGALSLGIDSDVSFVYGNSGHGVSLSGTLQNATAKLLAIAHTSGVDTRLRLVWISLRIWSTPTFKLRRITLGQIARFLWQDCLPVLCVLPCRSFASSTKSLVRLQVYSSWLRTSPPFGSTTLLRGVWPYC